MHKHTVFFWLKEGADAQERSIFRKGLEHLLKDPRVKEATIGEPAQTRRDVVDSSYDFAIIASFDNLDEHNAYQVGEHHEEFLQTCMKLWRRVQVFDIETN